MIIQSILQIDSFTGGFFFLFLQGSETFAHTTLFFFSFFFLFFFGRAIKNPDTNQRTRPVFCAGSRVYFGQNYLLRQSRRGRMIKHETVECL